MQNYDSIVNGPWNSQAEALSEKLGINERCTDSDKN